MPQEAEAAVPEAPEEEAPEEKEEAAEDGEESEAEGDEVDAAEDLVERELGAQTVVAFSGAGLCKVAIWG